MGISITLQAQIFLLSLLLGAAFGVLYDFFRALRVVFDPPPLIVFFEDILYAALCACLCFSFTLLTNTGEIRGYIFMGTLTGFIIYFCTVGALFIRWFKRAVNSIKHALKRLFNMIFKASEWIFIKNTEKIRKKLKNCVLFLKKPFLFLKKQCKILFKQLFKAKNGKRHGNKDGRLPVKSSERNF